MPAYSTLRTFINAVRTGRTNITETLDKLMTNPARHKLNTNELTLRQEHSLDAPLPDWMRRILKTAGMSDAEVSHLDIWPDDKKEEVRTVVVQAIDANLPVRFFWELHDGATPDNVISQREDGWTVRFRSPAAGVRLSHVNLGSVHVDA